MYNITHETIINNFKEIANKYQELILHFMQGKGSMIPRSLIDSDKNIIIVSCIIEQFCKNPQKFCQLNIEYIEKLRELTTNSFAKFVGNTSKDVFSTDNRDKRFKDALWEDNVYFHFVKQYYLLSAEWIKKNIEQYELSHDLKQHLEFTTKHFIDAFAPSNFAFCNPKVLRETLESGGHNLVQGLENFLRDIKSSGDILNINTTDKSAFKLGQNIAATKGKIIFQNDLMQLICYEPKEKVHKIPIFIIPPCINKYYILDLSSHNSLVSFLVENNFQVFLISWVNPDTSLSKKGFEDYLKEGILAPFEYVKNLGFAKIDFVGYCMGGMFLAIIIAYFKVKRIDSVHSSTFFTTLLDYTNPGELGIFLNKNTINYIKEEIKLKGYFDGKYLSNSFSLLRANDLIWTFFVNNYLLGKKPMPFDLLYWNADSTNLPAKMYEEYLHNTYCNNLLKESNALEVLGTKIDLGNVDCNSFFLAAKEDHITPWRSIYDGVKLLNGRKIFCLTDSGHVAGVVNHPDNAKYNYRLNYDLSLSSNEWFMQATEYKGSWWNYWIDWLIKNNDTKMLVDSLDYQNLDVIESAPGSYVRR
ncbi:class I poly(R)-hydroxyalkanoic acid synthase [Rickettsia prowazekii]|uniref:POLY-BETA-HYDROXYBUTYRATE POLYMERASE (PhbC2) n=2 Tax=Rickettsia prowazekii TaxID=782 RepID=Q9ZCD7_RICPR|nr:class I poly(R)-hydroxyalkanoic acid synthase [Rickettsia prowazekii]ADE30385.1 Poly(3-hydroxyalkanoate)synthetase [Rickettsia prowazekii str. Rp22]AFE49614.1 poly(3-hydroxyalkanoate) synthetase [Rickettsia prowazekii str. Chernikova]AFE50458.1 poly(3-hydroxyalkanoate) synthetase [Rickettsia prowazekii str. Katsinyian]AFE51302.1 poly(3-hydroxyalkanoate) synthetase [Rickettsia prowazekii str. BuV67-CWPP]AFE52140.1 poly(3-hydroxyalkanoate) synthetase [Rickettsia prowazekii str. Dachau]